MRSVYSEPLILVYSSNITKATRADQLKVTLSIFNSQAVSKHETILIATPGS